MLFIITLLHARLIKTDIQALERRQIEESMKQCTYCAEPIRLVCASGVDVRSEVLTCDGRIDLLMHVGDNIYIIEFKCNQSADAALQQIREKGYVQAYQQRGKKLILMGINFDTEQRNVAEWRVEA